MSVGNRTPIRFISFVFLIGLSIIACGDDESTKESLTNQSEHALSAMWAEGQTDAKRRRKVQLAESEPQRIGALELIQDSDHEDIEFVRETGFRSFFEAENDTALVRETGFIPTPVLTLNAIEDGQALLSWTSSPNVAHYVLFGQVLSDTPSADRISMTLRSTAMSIDLEGQTWEFKVIAVSRDKARRSKASNRVHADPDAE